MMRALALVRVGSDLVRKAFSGRFGRGVLWSASSTVVTQGSGFLTSIAIARLLGPALFGQFGIVQNTLLTLVSVGQLGTGVTATKYTAELRSSDKSRAGRVLGLCSIVTLATGGLATALLVLNSKWIAAAAFGEPALANALKYSSLFVLFAILNGFQLGALGGLESFKACSIAGTYLAMLHLAFCLLPCLLWGLEGALIGLSISAFSRWAGFANVLHREARKQGIEIQRREGLREREILLTFAIPAALSGVISMPAIWLSNTMLVRADDGFVQMGLFSAVNNLRVVLLIAPGILNSVAISLVNHAKGSGIVPSYIRALRQNVKYSFLASTCGALLLVVCGSSLLRLYGVAFVTPASRSVLYFAALSIVLEATGASIYQAIQGHGRMWLSLIAIAIPRYGTSLMAACLLVPYWGATGLAASYAIGCFVALLSTCVISHKLRLFDHV